MTLLAHDVPHDEGGLETNQSVRKIGRDRDSEARMKARQRVAEKKHDL